jgi:uncharacterized protein (TIGR04222 family)
MKIEEHRGLWSAIDMWPPPRETDHMLPEPAWDIRNEVLALIVMLLTLPLLVSSYLYKVLSPFSLTAPQFLIFFPLLAISSIICFVLLQYEKSRSLHPLITAHYPPNVTVYQVAGFLYGKRRAIQAAIIDLIRRRLLVLTRDELFLVHKDRYRKPEAEQNPLIASFLKEERTAVSYDRIVYVWANETISNQTALHKLQKLANHKEPLLKRYQLLFLPYAVAIARFFQEIANGNLLDHLIIEMAALVLISIQLMKFVSRNSLVKRKVKKIIRMPKGVRVLHSDYVVCGFALEGGEVLERFSDGIVLTRIFGLGPVIDRVIEHLAGFFEYFNEEHGFEIVWDGTSVTWKST